ncbi:unnamed protein product [Allacma fusca]|uniref:Fatty acid desaturase domain-containing protein n=1 Tax=Allacma fusca TaxID=39272 RepID=A0A8J2JQP0_9HEXA|nr:unnamed protein product [Allacma fusca]
MLKTIIFAIVLANLSGLGVTIGAHRLWSHRSFKARIPLKILLATCFAFSCQGSIWMWAAWHPVHHKFAETDGDPHNSTRGFFYSHIGWLFTYDHPKFKKNLEKIDMSDVENETFIICSTKRI